MANLWGALQSTVNLTRKTWKALTFTMIDEGLATQRNALDVVPRDANGDVGIKINDIDDLTFTIDNTDTHTFHTAKTTTGTGTNFTVAGFKTLVVEITGATVTTSTVQFKGAGASGTFVALNGVRLTDLAVATSSSTVFSATPEVWIFDVAGLTSVQMNLSTLTGEGASVTVTGKAVG